MTKGTFWDAAKEWLRQNRAVAALAMRGASAPMRIVIYALYAADALCVVAMYLLRKNPDQLLLALGAFLVFTLAILLFVVPRYARLGKRDKIKPDPARNQPKPVQLVGHTVQPEMDTMARLHEKLTRAREIASQAIRSRYSGVEDTDVRANMFFPTYGSVDGEYVLKICPGLHLNMDRPKELKIALKPHQGLTGLVFRTGQPNVECRLDEGEQGLGGWDDEFFMTQEVATLVHPDLQWIMSMPLKMNGVVYGVVNIDGLRQKVNEDFLSGVMLQKLTDVPTDMAETVRKALSTNRRKNNG